MRKKNVSQKKVLGRTLIAVGGTMIAALWMFATPALAGHKHKPKHHRQDQVEMQRPVHHRGHVLPPPSILRAPRRVVVPTTIRKEYVEAYGPYYGGLAYHRPHRHDHEVYYFPVYRDHRYVYEPHYYCDGHRMLTNQVAYQGSNFSFRIRF